MKLVYPASLTNICSKLFVISYYSVFTALKITWVVFCACLISLVSSSECCILPPIWGSLPWWTFCLKLLACRIDSSSLTLSSRFLMYCASDSGSIGARLFSTSWYVQFMLVREHAPAPWAYWPNAVAFAFYELAQLIHYTNFSAYKHPKIVQFDVVSHELIFLAVGT